MRWCERRRSVSDGGVQPVVTYLANTIVGGRGRDAAKDSVFDDHRRRFDGRGSGRCWMRRGKPIVLADDEIVLNRWAADDLAGESWRHDHGHVLRTGKHARRLREHEPPPKFKLRAIVELENGRRQADARPPIRS